MKRNMILTFAIVASAALVCMGAGHEGGGGSVGGGRTIYRRHRVSVPRTSMPRAQNTVRDQSRPAYPRQNERGEAISKQAASRPPAQHAEVMRNTSFAHNRAQFERTETMPNHYYWHNENGMRYSHYYDGHNHWYGFYHGPTFYWTRFYGNRWWWVDPVYGRWVFWGGGFWWWAGPGGVPYVYIDNGYYPYEESGVTVEQAETQAPPPTSRPAPDKGTTTPSPDGKRMVQVSGAESQAFLYDKTVNPPSFLMYLGQNVKNVRFSGGTAGAPLQILVEFKDDTFALFDADGNSQSAAIKKEESSGAPPPEATAPPPPTSAPGQ